MAKTTTFALVLLLAVVAASATEIRLHRSRPESPVKSLAPPASNDYCKLCIEFSGDALNELLNLILNAGVIGGCGDLCSALGEKTGSNLLAAVCDIFCDIEGIKIFMDLVQKADLDPIYFCQELKVCPVNDNADAKVISFVSTPRRAPRGSTFNLQLVYSSTNGTGTGEMAIELQTVDGLPLGDSFLMEASPPGTYNATISVEAKPDPSCDPTQQPCEEWLPGQYMATMYLCNGECGSKHPHSKLLFQTSTTFNITA